MIYVKGQDAFNFCQSVTLLGLSWMVIFGRWEGLRKGKMEDQGYEEMGRKIKNLFSPKVGCEDKS